jgi:hypothetical protein
MGGIAAAAVFVVAVLQIRVMLDSEDKSPTEGEKATPAAAAPASPASQPAITARPDPVEVPEASVGSVDAGVSKSAPAEAPEEVAEVKKATKPKRRTRAVKARNKPATKPKKKGKWTPDSIYPRSYYDE